MEKVNTRIATSKTNNPTEYKSRQDAVNKYTRYPRYKPESISPRPDTRFKPNLQKNRDSYDKRLRTRSGAIYERYRNEVAEGGVEGGSKHGSKKVNVNYLLNFTLAPTDGRDSSSLRSSHGCRAKLPKYNKEQFLQANCQFIAREDGDYTIYCKNPDVLVHWSAIEEVRVPSYEMPYCPICLYTPIAAKITRCGHIYCWSCILHYLALTDKSWHKCPICFEAIHGTDLKSVLPITKTSITVGNKVSMCLMKREKGCMLPVPSVYKNSVSMYRIHDAESVTRYQKLLLASKTEVCQIIERERKELEDQLLREENEPEACFIESALKLLHERELLLNFTDISETKEKVEFGTSPKNDNTYLERTDDIITDVHHKSITSPAFDNICGTSATDNSDNKNASLVLLDVEASEDHKKGKGTFFFYQAEDGQHIYLHGLNVRMLIKEFGSLEDCPPMIEGHVLELEKISMTEVLRKRLRYLQHIPLTCEFQVAELNLNYLLSKATIEEFAGEVSKRCKQRNRKAREERKREKYIEVEENKRLGKYPSPTYNLNSPVQFPTCSFKKENHELSGLHNNESYESQYPSFGISGLSVKDDTEIVSSPPVTSFAQMLRDGQVSFSEALPQKSQLNMQNKKPILNHNDESSDDEQGAAAPEYHQSFSNAIQAAFDNAKNQEISAGNQATSKKKKKMKNRILFTTSMCRNK